jgi:hypothetical protein
LWCGGMPAGCGVERGGGDTGCGVGDGIGATVAIAVMFGAGVKVERRAGEALLPHAASNAQMASAAMTVLILVKVPSSGVGELWSKHEASVPPVSNPIVLMAYGQPVQWMNRAAPRCPHRLGRGAANLSRRAGWNDQAR